MRYCKTQKRDLKKKNMFVVRMLVPAKLQVGSDRNKATGRNGLKELKRLGLSGDNSQGCAPGEVIGSIKGFTRHLVDLGGRDLNYRLRSDLKKRGKNRPLVAKQIKAKL